MAISSEAALRQAGLRITKPRVAVLDVLVEHPHASADLITRQVAAKLGEVSRQVSRQAGYDVLAACVAGIRPCLTPSDGAGYALDEAEVVFWGFCPSCQLKQGSSVELRSFA